MSSDWEVSRSRTHHRFEVFVGIEGESVVQQFANRTSRPWEEWLPHVAELTGVAESNLTWDPLLGCERCPCSPGFRLSRPDDEVEDRRWTLRMRPSSPQVTNLPEAEIRALQLRLSVAIANDSEVYDD